MEILLLIGIILIMGQVGARLLRLIKIPQVVGFILMGVLLGKSALNLVKPETLSAVTGLALGLIGFTIGSQLRYAQLRKMGRSILMISFFEAFGAFLLVALSVWALTGHLFQGLVFGALASATAPAATVDVLEEYRCKGVFTTTLLAVVGIDDGIALLIFGFAVPFSKVLFSPEAVSGIGAYLIEPLVELGGSAFVGIVLGFVFARILKWFSLRADMLSVSLALVLIASGLAQQFHLSLIMTNMIMGITIGNLSPRGTRRIAETISNFTPPIYILFFALVGARLDVRLLPVMGVLGVIYILARAAGKFGGAYLGATLAGSPDSVRKYMGLALFSQAGVAIGLAIAASTDFATTGSEGAAFGTLVINTITATTFVVQMVGPSFTRIAVFKAGEAREIGR